MATKDTILIIEDDQALAQLVEDILGEEGFRTSWISDGNLKQDELARSKPSLILLDINLPFANGLEICRQLKGNDETKTIPIIMLTGRISETDVVLGLELGADDYVTKPFRPKELGARVRAVLRRTRQGPASGEATPVVTVGPITMDSQRHEARVADTPLALTLTEFRLLWVLASSPGKVFTREQLLEKVAKGESHVIDRNVDVHIGSLRKKLGEHGNLIVTVRGIGYKCKEVSADPIQAA